MKITTKENEKLVGIAEQVLKENTTIWKDKNKRAILSSYNGQVAALPVSIAMIGLSPTFAIYFQDKPDKVKNNEAKRGIVLDVVALMLKQYNPASYGFGNGEAMVRHAITITKTEILKKDVIKCSIALKQVIRTYELV